MSAARGTRRLGEGSWPGRLPYPCCCSPERVYSFRLCETWGEPNPGFDTRNLLQIELDTSGYKPGQVNAVFKILLDLLATIPGVQSVTGIS